MQADNTGFQTTSGSFQLERYPHLASGQGKQQPLRAWDAADEYLLQYLWQQPQLTPDSRILLLNDSFGALCVALHGYDTQVSSDSHLALQGCRRNFAINALPAEQTTFLNSLEDYQGPLDIVLVKVPKTLALLEEQLYRLRPHIDSNTLIVAAAMAKNIHNNTLKLFDKIIGTTTTSLAKKKARLIFCRAEPEHWQGNSPYPSYYTLENSHYRIGNHANVFSRASLDIGTRLFIEHLPSDSSARDIIDLGCGNGIVGLLAAEKNPAAKLHFYDESYMALASAQENFTAAFGNQRSADFRADNCLASAPAHSADLVLNNPPFHQQHAVGDHIAWQMFKDSHRVLRSDGELWVIGNRHLNYHNKLKRLFGNCQQIACNSKFVVLKACKRIKSSKPKP